MPKNKYCDCEEEGFCPRYKRDMVGRLKEICEGKNIDPAQAAAYRQMFLAEAVHQPDAPAVPLRVLPAGQIIDCPYAGPVLVDENGKARTKECSTCRGNVRVKVFPCRHPQTPDEVALQDCQKCPYRPGVAPSRNVLIRFPHGLGDTVALSAVLAHLKKWHSDWDIDVAQSTTAGWMYQNRKLGDYAEIFDLDWKEGVGSHPPFASTKATRCLREVFSIEPERELLRYRYEPSAGNIKTVDGLLSSFPANKPIVAVHTQSASWGKEQRNLPEGVVRAYKKWLKRKGLYCLDFDGTDYQIGVMAALLARTRLNVMIDSGPQKLALTTSTPLIGVWIEGHPYHYVDHPEAPQQLHLIPSDHERFLKRSYGVDRQPNVQAAYDWLSSRCCHHIYQDLFTGLVTATEMMLDERQPGPTGLPQVVSQRPPERKLLLHTGLPPGDVMTLTACVETLHKMHPGRFWTAVSTNYPEIWEGNPHVVADDGTFERVEMMYHTVNSSGNRPVHFIEGYTEFLGDYLDVPMRACVNRPHIYLSDEEKSWMNQCWQETNNPSPYWVVNAGVKNDYTCKYYPYFQEVVDLLRSRVRFVQVGLDSDIHPTLSGVVNLIGKTSIRALLRLVYHAQGVLSGVSFLMHAAAAFEKPGVIVAGGREPRLWNSYPTQMLLNNVGALDCCKTGGCWRSKVVPLGDRNNEQYCAHPMPTVPLPAGECMTRINPVLVAESIKSFLP